MQATTSQRPVEVRVYKFGLLKVCEWCADDADAARVVEMWTACGGVRCEIVDSTNGGPA